MPQGLARNLSSKKGWDGMGWNESGGEGVREGEGRVSIFRASSVSDESVLSSDDAAQSLSQSELLLLTSDFVPSLIFPCFI